MPEPAFEPQAKAWSEGGHVVAALQRGCTFAETALPAKMLREQRHVFEMEDLGFRRGLPRQIHLDDVKAKSGRFHQESCQITSDRPAQNPSFPIIDRMITGYQRIGIARLHLDKDQHAPVTRHEVDLLAPIPRAAPIPRHDRKRAFAPQPSRGEFLAPRPDIAGVAKREQGLQETAHGAKLAARPVMSIAAGPRFAGVPSAFR